MIRHSKKRQTRRTEIRHQFTLISRLKNCELSHTRRLSGCEQWNERIHLEFANGCHIYQDYSDLKDDLFYRFAFMTFDYYEDIRRQAGIVAEPEGCKEKTFTPSESCFTRVTIRAKWWNTTSKNTFCPPKKIRTLHKCTWNKNANAYHFSCFMFAVHPVWCYN